MNNLINAILVALGVFVGYVLVSIPTGLVLIYFYRLGMQHERVIWEAQEKELVDTLWEECNVKLFQHDRPCSTPEQIITTYEAPCHEVLGVFGEN